MNEIPRFGDDLVKCLTQVHAVDAAGKLVTNLALKLEKIQIWCANLPTGCLVAMDACSRARLWRRKLIQQGFDAQIIPGSTVAPYRIQGHSGKNDAKDAAAVWDAASRPHMNFLPQKH